MNGKFYGALGLAQKAGKCKSGEFAVTQAMARGNVVLVVLDGTASAATKDRFRTDCEKHGVRYLEASDVGNAIGKPERMILGITDTNFMKMILGAAEASNE